MLRRGQVKDLTSFANMSGKPGEPTPLNLDLFARWGCLPDDLRAKAIERKLASAWRTWPEWRRELLLSTSEALANAGPAKPKRTATRSRMDRQLTDLAKAGLAAARLALSLSESEALRKTTVVQSPAVSALVSYLLAFGSAALRVTSALDSEVARGVGSKMLERLEETSSPKSDGISRELLTELVWLAGGMKGEPLNEATVRRFGLVQPLKSPVAKVWGPNWTTMRAAGRLLGKRGESQLVAELADELRRALK